MHIKKLFALFLPLLLLLSLCACDSFSQEPPTPQNDDLVVQQDNTAELFNAAVDKLNAAGSYRMTGTISSIAEILRGEGTISSDDIDLDPPTIVSYNFDCAYSDGKMLLDCPTGSYPHSTYFDGEIYYHSTNISGKDVKYFTPDPSFEDYPAAMYLKNINAEMVFSPAATQTEAGETQLSFEIPFAFYKSEALVDLLGILVDETHSSQYISVKATLDSEGYFTSVYMSFSTVTQFGDESISQELLVSLRFSDYASTQVTPPADLAVYEDWSEEPAPSSTAPMVELTPEDLE